MTARLPACSPGIGEDGKQVFKLQWPNSYQVHTTNLNYLNEFKSIQIQLLIETLLSD